MQKRRYSGFTLIELVVVISILGLLAAFALPKFAALQAEARIAKMNGALASIKSAATLAHAVQLSKGLAANTVVTLESVTIAMVNAYPAAASIDEAAGIATPDYSVSVSGNTATVAADTEHPNCAVTYTEALAGAAPIYASSNVNPANCG